MILDEIVAHKRAEVAAQRLAVPLEQIEERITQVEPARDFRAALRKPGIGLIAEIKRKSPSKGDLLPDVNAVELGDLYEQCGARAISVLTDKKYFGGTIEDLTAVRTNLRVPVLRKEFVIDPYQIYEARAAEADAILLIVRILSDEQLREYRELALKLGMAALVEAHTADEIDRAIDTGAHIIGINNRDLDTLDVDVNVTLELKRRVPGGKLLVSESGIYTRKHVRMLEDGGVDGILVGESLLTSKNIREKIEELLGHDAG